MKRLATLLLLAWLSAGCAHRVRVESTPPGATVKMGERVLGVTPMEKTVLWWPFRRIPVRVSMPGYRTVGVELGRSASLWSMFRRDLLGFRWGRFVGARVRGQHELILVKRHGRSGTWTPEDALEE